MNNNCERWSEHDWDGGRLLDTGKHPTMGPFVRWKLACTRPGCTRTTIRTDWPALPVAVARPTVLENEA